MGLCTGFGGGGLLVNLVGYNRALDLIISGRKLRAEEGLRLGYFDAGVSEGRGVEDGLEWLERRTKHCTPLVIKNTKAVLRQRLSIPGKKQKKFTELYYYYCFVPCRMMLRCTVQCTALMYMYKVHSMLSIYLYIHNSYIFCYR